MIYLLTGGMKQKPDGSFRTLGPQDSDRGLLSNDRWRVDAVALFSKSNPGEQIIISGGKNSPRDPVDGPTLAEVSEKELFAEGISSAVMSRDDLGGSTYRQLQYLNRLNTSEVVRVVSNEWHLPRVFAMILFAPGLENLRGPNANIVLLAAENILLDLASDKWKNEIERVRKLPEYAKRAGAEAEGIRQIITGEYRFS